MDKFITTTTGIKHADLIKFGLNAEIIGDKLDALVFRSKPEKKHLNVGTVVFDTEDKDGNPRVEVYTTEEHDAQAGFDALDHDAQVKCYIDGYKRQFVNRPAHESVKASLGIKEETKASAEKKAYIVKTLSNAVKAGLTNEQIHATFPDMDTDALDEAIETLRNNN